jgi:hypothetical protein
MCIASARSLMIHYPLLFAQLQSFPLRCLSARKAVLAMQAE